ncbi:hypothetical protein KCU77_g811, partial [Aureobasidium melanogenum]
MLPLEVCKDRLIVNLDFGTIFSGCVLTYTGSFELPDEIEAIKNWSGFDNITPDKVPSEVTYEPTSSGTGVKRETESDDGW